jgi:hypothetical protein
LVEGTNWYYHKWTHWTKDSPHSLMWLLEKCICSLLLLYKWGTIRGIHWKITGPHQNSSTWSVVETLWNKTRFFSVLRSLQFSSNNIHETEKERWKLQLIAENGNYIWQAQWFIC